MQLLSVEPTVFGGFQSSSVLADGSGSFTVIDMANCGAHWPLEDLAWGIELLAQFGLDTVESLIPFLMDAYLEGRVLARSEWEELHLWMRHSALGYTVAYEINAGKKVSNAMEVAEKLIALTG